jgi:NADH:ubiquinone oxidoreductase subunit K
VNAINLYLTLGTVLFGLGLWGVFTRRNAIAVLMAIELMLNGVNINFVAAQRFGARAQGWASCSLSSYWWWPPLRWQ